MLINRRKAKMLDEKSVITYYIEQDESELLQRKLKDDQSIVVIFFIIAINKTFHKALQLIKVTCLRCCSNMEI